MKLHISQQRSYYATSYHVNEVSHIKTPEICDLNQVYHLRRQQTVCTKRPSFPSRVTPATFPQIVTSSNSQVARSDANLAFLFIINSLFETTWTETSRVST